PLRYIHDTGSGGILAAFTQTVAGVDVFRDEVHVLMDRDHQLVAISGYIPSRDLIARTGTPEFRLDASRALDVALADFSGQGAAGGARFVASAEGGYEHWDVSAETAAWPADLQPGGPVRVKRVLFHMPDALVPAWYVEVMGSTQATMYVVSAS